MEEDARVARDGIPVGIAEHRDGTAAAHRLEGDPSQRCPQHRVHEEVDRPVEGGHLVVRYVSVEHDPARGKPLCTDLGFVYRGRHSRMELNTLGEALPHPRQERSGLPRATEPPRISDSEPRVVLKRAERKPPSIDAVGHVPPVSSNSLSVIMRGQSRQPVALDADHIRIGAGNREVSFLEGVGEAQRAAPGEEGMVCEEDSSTGPSEVAQPPGDGPQRAKPQSAAHPHQILDFKSHVNVDDVESRTPNETSVEKGANDVEYDASGARDERGGATFDPLNPCRWTKLQGCIRGKVKVLVNMFGRETPVELDFLQVKKI